MADETTPPDNALPVSINANTLRRLAEEADGRRGERLVLRHDVEQRDGSRGVGLVALPDGSEPKETDIVVETSRQAPGKPRPKRVIVVHPVTGKEIDIPTDKYDALFWDEAAAEKFLVPYYARFYTDAQMARLRESIRSDSVIAIVHGYPSFEDDVTDEITPP